MTIILTLNHLGLYTFKLAYNNIWYKFRGSDMELKSNFIYNKLKKGKIKIINPKNMKKVICMTCLCQIPSWFGFIHFLFTFSKSFSYFPMPIAIFDCWSCGNKVWDYLSSFSLPSCLVVNLMANYKIYIQKT